MTGEEKQIKLMIVDDEVNFLNSIAARLEIQSFDVTTASDGKTALKLAKKGGFDVAILDLRMPDMDGTEILKALKKKHKFLEVIMLTGHGSIDSAVECTKLGAFGYLEKPYDFEQLVAVLKDAYKARLKKKFEHDRKRTDEIEYLSMGNPLSILRALKHLDDDVK